VESFCKKLRELFKVTDTLGKKIQHASSASSASPTSSAEMLGGVLNLSLGRLGRLS